jgi:hypothetical protein
VGGRNFIKLTLCGFARNVSCARKEPHFHTFSPFVSSIFSFSNMSSQQVPSNLVAVGMGNPLLDISAQVPVSLLEKYKLKPSDAILAAAVSTSTHERCGSSATSFSRIHFFFFSSSGAHGIVH